MTVRMAKEFKPQAQNTDAHVSWAAIGFVSAFGFSALVWAGLYSLVRNFL